MVMELKDLLCIFESEKQVELLRENTQSTVKQKLFRKYLRIFVRNIGNLAGISTEVSMPTNCTAI